MKNKIFMLLTVLSVTACKEGFENSKGGMIVTTIYADGDSSCVYEATLINPDLRLSQPNILKFHDDINKFKIGDTLYVSKNK